MSDRGLSARGYRRHNPTMVAVLSDGNCDCAHTGGDGRLLGRLRPEALRIGLAIKSVSLAWHRHSHEHVVTP
jgi:hypothetical protein